MGLLDSGCQCTNISEQFCWDNGLEILPIEHLCDITQADGSVYDYLGYTELTLTCSEFPTFKLDLPALVVPTTEYHEQVPITIGTHTLAQMLESKSLPDKSKMSRSWNYAIGSMEHLVKLAANPSQSLGKVKTTKSILVPPMSSILVPCLHKVKGHGMHMNVMVEPKVVKQANLEILPSAHLLKLHESKLPIQVRNNSIKAMTIPKNTLVGEIHLCNTIPKIMGSKVVFNKKDQAPVLSDQTDIKTAAANSTNPLSENSSKFSNRDQTVKIESLSNSTNPQKKVSKKPKRGKGTFKSVKTDIVNQEILAKLDLSGMAEWDKSTQLLAKSVLQDYQDVISQHDMDLGKTDLIKHDIKLDNYKPFKQAFRRIPPHLYDKVREHLKEMLQIGAIRPSHSPWSSAIVLVQKKDGSLRFCIDLRELNNRTIKDNYSLPRIDHHLEQLKGAVWFTTLDLKSGYWQVELTEDSKPLTAFTVGPLGFYECEQMPFGACNAPATFQRLMESCLGDLNLKWCVVYLDDIIIYSKTPEEHVERLRAVLQKLREAGLKIKPSKCNFFKKEISFLGHIVSEQGIATDPKKIEKVVQWPIPDTVNDVRSFLGFTGYYRRYIKNYSSVAKPLTNLLAGHETNSKKAAGKLRVPWGTKEQKAFDLLKLACTCAPVLGYADFTKPFIVHTDSSLDGLGAVLYQKDEDSKMKVISYASRSLSKSEKLYPAHKLEFLALKWAITDKFKDYLYGAHFEVYTDNNPLTYVLTSAKLDATGQRWVASLANFSFDIFYRSQKHNIDADRLSRIKWPQNTNDVLSNRQLCVFMPETLVQAICLGAKIPFGYSETLGVHSQIIPKQLNNIECGMNHEHWVSQQQNDKVIQYLSAAIKNKQLRKKSNKTLKEECPGIENYLKYRSNLVLRDKLLYKKTYSCQGKQSFLLQLVLPTALIPDALIGCHDEVGHLGRDKSTQLLKERFFWPGMSKDMNQHIAECRKCIARKGVTSKAPLCPITATKPLELVHLDYLQLEPSKGNIENVLVITDHFTRFAQAYPSKTQTAQATAKLIWENFIVHYGFPEQFFSDQGRNFVSELIQDLCKIAKVKKIRTTPYHPQSNGQCERFNKTLCDMLGTLNPEDKLDWKSHISSLTHAYNCTQNASTGYSPYYLMFGRQPRLPIDVKFGLFRNLSNTTFSKSKYIDRLKKRLDYAYKKAQEAQSKSSKKSKERYDKSSKSVFIEPGDLVLVRVVAHKGRHKIQNRWEDEEYVVVDQPNSSIPVYTVKPITGGKERILHRNLLLPLGTKVKDEDLLSDDSDEEIVEIIFPQKASESKEALQEAQASEAQASKLNHVEEVSSLEGEKEIGQPCSKSDDKSDCAEMLQESVSDDEQISADIPFSPELEDFPSEWFKVQDSDTESSGSEPTQSTVLDSAFKQYREVDTGNTSSFFRELPESQEDQDSSESLDKFLNKLETDRNYIQPAKLGVETDSSSESETEVETVPIQTGRRVSSRKTKGAPPTRFGEVYTHNLRLEKEKEKEPTKSIKVIVHELEKGSDVLQSDMDGHVIIHDLGCFQPQIEERNGKTITKFIPKEEEKQENPSSEFGKKISSFFHKWYFGDRVE